MDAGWADRWMDGGWVNEGRNEWMHDGVNGWLNEWIHVGISTSHTFEISI